MNEPIVSEQRLEGAMEFLALSDETYALQKAGMENAEIVRKRVRARLFIAANGTVAERQAKAEIAEDTEAADDAYVQCLKNFEQTRAKRQRAELVIDVWRSLEASRRKS